MSVKQRATKHGSSAAQLPDRAQVDPGKWNEFMQGQGLAGVKLADYYDVELLPGSATLEVEILAVAKEMLCDLVAVGAITLPRDVYADDFSFEVRTEQIGNYNFRSEHLYLKKPRGSFPFIKAVKQEVLCFPNVDSYLNDRTKLGDFYTSQTVDRLCVAVREMFIV